MAENEVKNKKIEKQTATKYTKARLMASEAYKAYRDLLSVLLKDNESYTREEVSRLIDEYLKRGVR